MKFLPARVFALTFLITTLSFLNGEEGREQTLFVDSINLQVMTDLTMPGWEDPLTITQDKLFSIPFSEEQLAFSLPELASSENSQEAVIAIYNFLLKNAPKGEYTFSSINELQRQIVGLLKKSGYYGIAVVVDPDQIDMQTGDDFRGEDDRSLNLQIWIGEVVSQRTVAKGTRIKEGSLINNPLHKKVIENSPFAPGSKLNASGTFLIDKSILDDYALRLNRSRNRRVDIAVSSAGEPGKLVLDYVVNEPKSWLGYIQVSNTGTESTGEWRERIGGIHYQLTGNDDVLAIDYFTAEFDSANALVASYDFPLMGPDYLISKTYASYSDFASENILIPTAEDAIGRTITYGTEFIHTPFYLWEHAVSVILGIKYEDVTVENIGANEGLARFFSPSLRVDFSKSRQVHRSFVSARIETNLKDNDESELSNFGRQFITDDYDLLSFRLFQSLFIEPLLPGYRKIKDDKWLANSLVHELAFSLRGQYVMNNRDRLIPQKQLFAGGFFSVRGYNESATQGDNGTIGSFEYRVHLARLLKPYSLLEDTTPKEQVSDIRVRDRFNFRAPSVYGLPDWNLMARFFVDWAQLSINEPRTATELDQDLLSYGIGFELQYLSNLNIRLDYGVVSDDLETSTGSVEDDGDRGDSRFHFLATFSF